MEAASLTTLQSPPESLSSTVPIAQARKPLAKVTYSEMIDVTVISVAYALRGYALRGAVGSASKGLKTVTSQSNVLQVLPAIAKNREPTSGLEPLTCSLRVIIHALQGFAQACKPRIFRRLSLLRVAVCCTIVRSWWCQSGVKVTLLSS